MDGREHIGLMLPVVLLALPQNSELDLAKKLQSLVEQERLKVC